MDGTRPRRTLDDVRQQWYAAWRAMRFARYLGYVRDSYEQDSEGPSAAHPSYREQHCQRAND